MIFSRSCYLNNSGMFGHSGGRCCDWTKRKRRREPGMLRSVTGPSADAPLQRQTHSSAMYRVIPLSGIIRRILTLHPIGALRHRSQTGCPRSMPSRVDPYEPEGESTEGCFRANAPVGALSAPVFPSDPFPGRPAMDGGGKTPRHLHEDTFVHLSAEPVPRRHSHDLLVQMGFYNRDNLQSMRPGCFQIVCRMRVRVHNHGHPR